MSDSPHPFSRLTPESIIDAVESCGYRSDCRVFPLNSYENRVWQVGIEDALPLIAKFYRPGRWSDAGIREEHAFAAELAGHELPIVPPLADSTGETLFSHAGFRFALFRRQGGHAPEFDNLDNLLILGRLLGRIHAIGALHPFAERPELNIDSFGVQSVDYILTTAIPAVYRENYRAVSSDLLAAVDHHWKNAGAFRAIRCHGDCHAGNILWRDNLPHFVDFDDCRNAPAMQDLWMMLSGPRYHRRQQLDELLAGYEEFCDFNRCELRLIEPLRALRMLHYAGWLAARQDDPAFQAAFPWSGTDRYWEGHILELREQLQRLQEESL